MTQWPPGNIQPSSHPNAEPTMAQLYRCPTCQLFGWSVQPVSQCPFCHGPVQLQQAGVRLPMEYAHPPTGSIQPELIGPSPGPMTAATGQLQVLAISFRWPWPTDDDLVQQVHRALQGRPIQRIETVCPIHLPPNRLLLLIFYRTDPGPGRPAGQSTCF